MSQLRTKKLQLLRIINDQKEILFCDNNKIAKENAWKEVQLEAQTLKLAGPHRKWSYIKDSIFGVWKKSALAKYNSTNTKNIDIVDQYIINNFCSEVTDQSKQLKSYDIEIKKENPHLIKTDTIKTETESIMNTNNSPMEMKKLGKRKLHTDLNVNVTTVGNVKRQKLFENKDVHVSEQINSMEITEKMLKIELLKHDIYYRKLQCLSLEQDLNLKVSIYTEDLYPKK